MSKIYIKNKKMFKSKFQMVIYSILFVLLFASFIYLGKMDFNEEVLDNERFSESFNLVSRDNVFKYAKSTDVRMISRGLSGIVLFGTTNEWVNYYAFIVNKAAKEAGIENIYYYDFIKNRTDNNGTYEDIVNNLSEYVTINDRGKAEIYAPSLLVVYNNKVLLFDSETSFVSGNITPSEYWNREKINEKVEYFKEIFLQYNS